MLDNCTTKEERWEGVQRLVNAWLMERQELVVIYCSLSGVSNFSADSDASIQKLKLFCQILLDYVSAGHFEVYDQLLQEAEDYEDGSAELLSQLYPQIKATTDVALDFNDTYDTEEHCKQSLEVLKEKLSALGEELATRFAMEDQLIEKLHTAHSEEAHS